MQSVSAIPNLDNKYKNIEIAECDGKKSCVFIFFFECSNGDGFDPAL